MDWSDSFMVHGFIWGFATTFGVLLISIAVSFCVAIIIDARKRRGDRK